MPRMEDMPSSGAFLRSSVHPVQVGSPAWIGSVAVVKATRLATSSIDNRVLNGVPPGLDQRRDSLRIRPTICPFQGATASYGAWGFEERRIGAISRRIRENVVPCGGLPPFHGRGAAPRGRSPVNHPPFLSKPEPCFAARARHSCATL